MVKHRLVNLSRIPVDKRADAWKRLKEKYPAQAALVEDELVQLVHQRFNAEISIWIPIGDGT